MSFANPALASNIYNQNKGVLLQFILSEFIKSYKEVLTIYPFSENAAEINQKAAPALKSTITRLTGPLKNYGHLSLRGQEEGILSRLKNYCANFSLQEDKKNKTILKMQRAINQAFLSSLQSLDALHLLEKEDSPHRNVQVLHRILKKIVLQMNRFSKLTAFALQQFYNDENVIFFILCHKTDLDQLYGSQFVFKLISRIYPKGLEEASDFLLSRYKKRGFNHLIPLIKKQIAELKK